MSTSTTVYGSRVMIDGRLNAHPGQNWSSRCLKKMGSRATCEASILHREQAEVEVWGKPTKSKYCVLLLYVQIGHSSGGAGRRCDIILKQRTSIP
jgi:hypothetical protein